MFFLWKPNVKILSKFRNVRGLTKALYYKEHIGIQFSALKSLSKIASFNDEKVYKAICENRLAETMCAAAAEALSKVTAADSLNLFLHFKRCLLTPYDDSYIDIFKSTGGIKILLDLIKNNEDKNIKTGAKYLLLMLNISSKDTEILEFLKSSLNNRDSITCPIIIKMIAKTGENKSFIETAHELFINSRDAEVQNAALLALLQLGADTNLLEEASIMAMKNDKLSKTAACVRAFINDDIEVDLLCKFLLEGDYYTISTIIDPLVERLVKIQSKAAVGPLCIILDNLNSHSKNSDFTEKIISALGNPGEKRAVKSLCKFIKSPYYTEYDKDIYIRVINILGELGDDSASSTLKDLLPNDFTIPHKPGGMFDKPNPSDLRPYVMTALEKIGGKQAVSILFNKLSHTTEPSVKYDIIMEVMKLYRADKLEKKYIDMILSRKNEINSMHYDKIAGSSDCSGSSHDDNGLRI